MQANLIQIIQTQFRCDEQMKHSPTPLKLSTTIPIKVDSAQPKSVQTKLGQIRPTHDSLVQNKSSKVKVQPSQVNPNQVNSS